MKKYAFKKGSPPVVVVSAPSPAGAIARRAAPTRRAGASAALRRYKDKAAQAVRSSRATLSRWKAHIVGARGLGAAALGGSAVALVEEYIVEDVAGLPTAIPVALGLHVLSGKAGRLAGDMACMAHGAAGVAGYQLTQDYVLQELRDLLD